MGGIHREFVLPSLAQEDGYDPWGQCNNSWGWCTDPQCGTQGAAMGAFQKWCVGWHHGHLNFLHSPWKKLPSQRGNYSSQPSFSKGVKLCPNFGGCKVASCCKIVSTWQEHQDLHIVLQGQAGLKGDDWRAGNHRVGQLSQLSQKIDLDGGRSAPAKMIANSRSWFNFNEIQVLAACLSLSLVCQVVLMCMAEQ